MLRSTVADQGRGKSGRLERLAFVSMTKQRSWAHLARPMVDSMIPRVQIRHVALVLVFAFCQIIGTTCALPDFSVAAGAAQFVDEGMACPLEGTTMCPPSLTSSPERQIKHSMVSGVDHAPVLLSVSTARASRSVPAPWSWSSVLSIVPISIRSSSVLRI